jgi:hypothetical protein
MFSRCKILHVYVFKSWLQPLIRVIVKRITTINILNKNNIINKNNIKNIWKGIKQIVSIKPMGSGLSSKILKHNNAFNDFFEVRNAPYKHLHIIIYYGCWSCKKVVGSSFKHFSRISTCPWLIGRTNHFYGHYFKFATSKWNRPTLFYNIRFQAHAFVPTSWMRHRNLLRNWT